MMLSGLFIKSIMLKESIDSSSYLASLPAIKYLSDRESLAFTKPVTFFVGENGTGKSTLIEAIAIAYGFNPEGGTKNFNFSTEQSHSALWEHLRISKGFSAKTGFFLRAESFYNVASNIDELDREFSFGRPAIDSYGGISLHKQSHGESFMALVQNRFGKEGCYILDEPEAALSPMRLLTLITEINHLVKNNSQFIIATHSPILMAFPNAEILEFSENGIRSVNYKETEHYQITRRFLDNPDKMLSYLLDD